MTRFFCAGFSSHVRLAAIKNCAGHTKAFLAIVHPDRTSLLHQVPSASDGPSSYGVRSGSEYCVTDLLRAPAKEAQRVILVGACKVGLFGGSLSAVVSPAPTAGAGTLVEMTLVVTLVGSSALQGLPGCPRIHLPHLPHPREVNSRCGLTDQSPTSAPFLVRF